MKSEDIICEVLLSTYKDFEHLSTMCDKCILRTATKSYQIDVYEAFDAIVNLMAEKAVYDNLKSILDEAIEKLKKNKELKYRYLFGYRLTEIEELIGVKENVVCHRVLRQKARLFLYMQCKYNAEQLFDLIKDSKLLIKKYRRMSDEKATM